MVLSDHACTTHVPHFDCSARTIFLPNSAPLPPNTSAAVRRGADDDGLDDDALLDSLVAQNSKYASIVDGYVRAKPKAGKKLTSSATQLAAARGQLQRRIAGAEQKRKQQTEKKKGKKK